MLRFISNSPETTLDFAARLGSFLSPGDFVSLHGELGAGKTRFAGGIAAGLGVDPSVPITSPTYTLMNIYQGRVPLYHFDLYRLHGDDDATGLGFHDYFSGNGICLVEWAERLNEELPDSRLDVFLSYLGESSRLIELSSSAKRFESVILSLSSMTKTVKM